MIHMKIPKPVTPFIRENVLEGVYRGDFYNVKVGHRFDRENWSSMFDRKMVPTDDDMAPFHFGKLVSFGDVAEDNDGNGQIMIENEEGAILRSTPVSRRSKFYKKWHNVLDANIGRPIIVVMETVMSEEGNRLFYAVSHDPKAVTLAKNGSMYEDAFPPKNNTEPLIVEKLIDYQEIDWAEVEGVLGPAATQTFLDRFEDYASKVTNDPEQDQIAVGHIKMDLMEAMDAQLRRQRAETYLPQTKKLLQQRKATVTRHGLQKQPYTWIEFGHLSGYSYREDTKGDGPILRIISENVDIGPLEFEEWEGSDWVPIDLLQKLDKYEGNEILVCKTGPHTFVDVATFDTGLEDLELQLASAATDVINKRETVKEQGNLYDARLEENAAEIHALHRKHERDNSELTDELREFESKIQIRREKLDETLLEELGPLNDKKQDIEQNLSFISDMKNELPLDIAKRDIEADKLLALQEYWRPINARAKAQWNAVNKVEELSKWIEESQNTQVASWVTGLPMQQPPPPNAADLGLSPDKVIDASATAQTQFSASASAEVVKSDGGESAEVARLKAELRALQAEKDAAMAREEAAKSEAAIIKLSSQQNEWQRLNEEEKQALMLQLDDEGHQQWSEEKKQEFFNRTDQVIEDYKDKDGVEIPINIVPKARGHLAMRGGVIHTDEKLIIRFKGKPTKPNRFVVFLPQHNIEIIACLDYDKRDSGQLTAITFLSMKQGWKKQEDRLLGAGGKWDIKVTLEERQQQGKQISQALMLASSS